ncbi:SET domain-containing protein [Saccharata proteae CBS 121410]|uniref:SET domain-containing protein n=1 Tax=Saccharata proteae CBS 121410 TaxID=1314787 RepID=A0A9P4HXE3_9PEZI|nr:SET domain-containing protein [Saccharata proteae CBS 121410]
MIRRGRAEGWLKLDIGALKPWAKLNNVQFNGITVGPLPGLEQNGSTVIAERDLSGGDEEPLMRIPRDLVLSLEGVREYAKSDRHLREVLEALGEFGQLAYFSQTARISILVFLLMQATACCPLPGTKIGVPNPMTEYVRFLPEELLPTFWTENERLWPRGTTLLPAVSAKLVSLRREYEQLRKATEHIKWCAETWWDETDGLLGFDDWLQVDAMYRSRALEFPNIGDSMVPCVDMANHASGDATVALYETVGGGDAALLLRDDKKIKAGEEIMITYGDKKGACEMLFSYGFIETTQTTARELFLDLEIPRDDPLRQAKLHINSAAPGFRIFDHTSATTEAATSTDWESDFVWLVVVNEEDGLDFQVLQTTDGAKKLRALWQDEELSDPETLGQSLRSTALWQVYRLRAVALLQERVETQLRALYDSDELVENAKKSGSADDRETRVLGCASRLRELERDLLERAYGDLETEKDALLQTEVVQNYLQSMAEARQGEEDFS